MTEVVEDDKTRSSMRMKIKNKMRKRGRRKEQEREDAKENHTVMSHERN